MPHYVHILRDLPLRMTLYCMELSKGVLCNQNAATLGLACRFSTYIQSVPLRPSPQLPNLDTLKTRASTLNFTWDSQAVDLSPLKRTPSSPYHTSKPASRTSNGARTFRRGSVFQSTVSYLQLFGSSCFAFWRAFSYPSRVKRKPSSH